MIGPLVTQPLFSQPIGARPSRAKPPQYTALTPEVENELLNELYGRSGQFIENLGLALDTPGAIARGVLAGDPLSGFSWDNDRRVTPEELNKAYGINPTNPWAKFGANFATGVVTDPLFWFSSGLSSVSRAGDAARAAGLLKNAPLAYLNKFGTEAAENTMRGKYITGLMDAADVPRTLGNYKAVSPVGQRLAQANVTLDDVVKMAADPDLAKQQAINRLGSEEAFDAVKDDVLGGLLGLNVGRLNMSFKPPGSDAALDALDWLGARTRFSKAGLLATSLTSKAVEGATDVGGQFAALRANMLEDMFKQRGQAEATRHNLLLTKITLSDNAKSLLGADTLYSPQGNDMLTRLAEGKGNATDLRILAETPGIKDWLTSWDMIRNRQFSERAAMGLKGAKYRDQYGVRYSPRYGDELDFQDMAKGTGRMLYTAAEPESMSRKWYLRTPGGTDDIRQLSLLPEVIAHSQRGARTSDEDIGQVILNWFQQNHPAEPIGLEQATKIARVLVRRKQDLPAGVPVFAAHPANAQVRRIVSHEVAMGRSQFILESLAEAAMKGSREKQIGRWRNLQDSFNEIASKAGFSSSAGNAGKQAVNRLRIAVGQAMGVDPSAVDLSKFAVPERVVRRLQTISDFYSVPKAQEQIFNFLDGWTTLNKGFLLATPRRFVRDKYSNAISGFLETGNAPLQLSSTHAASKIVNGNYEGGMYALRKIPAYAALGSDEAIKEAFIMDVGTHGVLAGLQSSELLSHARTGQMGQLIPGSTPLSIGKGVSELFNLSGYSPKNFSTIYGVYNPFTGKTSNYDTLNPILRASTAVGDAIDSTSRLGTFIALMRQGNSPAEAAARVRKALVDYQSLTLTERKWMKSIFPWYSYQSRSAAWAVENMYMRPGGSFAQMIRFANEAQRTDGTEDYIPENLRKSFSIRLPDEFAKAIGMYKPGVTTSLVDVDFPAVDSLNLIDPNAPISGTIRNLLGQAAPLPQALGALAFQQDLFTGRPLEESTTPQDRVYKALFNDPKGLSGVAKVGIGLIPGTQIPLSILGALTDERIDPWQRPIKAGINFATGVKIKHHDEKFIIDEMERKAGEALSGRTRTLEKQYIPEEFLPTLTPRELALWELKQKLNKKSQTIRKDRKKQEEDQKRRQEIERAKR